MSYDMYSSNVHREPLTAERRRTLTRAATTHGDPTRAVLAMLRATGDHRAVRAWCLRQPAGSGLRDLAANRAAWRGLIASATTAYPDIRGPVRASRPSSPEAAADVVRQANVRLARRLVGFVFDPGLDPAVKPRTAALAGVLVTDQIGWNHARHVGWDSFIANTTDLGARLGCTRTTVTGDLQCLAGARLIRQVTRSRPAVPARWRTVRLTTTASAAANSLINVTEALATDPREHPLAELVASVSHPIWSAQVGFDPLWILAGRLHEEMFAALDADVPSLGGAAGVIDALVAASLGPMRLRWRDEHTAVLHPAGPVLDQTIGWQHQPVPRRRSLAYVVLDGEVEAQPGLYLCGAGGTIKLIGLVRPGHPMWTGWLLWAVRCLCEYDLAEAAEFIAVSNLWEARVVRVGQPQAR